MGASLTTTVHLLLYHGGVAWPVKFHSGSSAYSYSRSLEKSSGASNSITSLALLMVMALLAERYNVPMVDRGWTSTPPPSLASSAHESAVASSGNVSHFYFLPLPFPIVRIISCSFLLDVTRSVV